MKQRDFITIAFIMMALWFVMSAFEENEVPLGMFINSRHIIIINSAKDLNV